MATETPSFLECALITGASSGLGSEFAQQLAPICQHLVLIARREDRLREHKTQLETDYPSLRVTIIACDLESEASRLALFSTLKEHQISPTLLVNNAGLGDYGDFASSDWQKIRAMLDVNMTALTHLSYHFVQDMKTLGSGAVINISSIASLLPIPDFAVYAATKAYVTSFSEGLRSELAEENIPVLTVCPGPVHTEFGEVAGRNNEKFEIKGYEHLYVTAEDVVTETLNSLFKNEARLYPGWKVALFATILTALPICLVRYVNAKRPRKLVDSSDEPEQH